MSKKKVKLIDGSKTRLVLLGIVFVSFTCFSRSDAASFQGLGYVPGWDWVSQAYAVSADGSVVVGISRSHFLTVAFRWTAEDGMQNLGYLSGENTTEATGVSANGSIVVGWSQKTGSGDVEAFRWTESAGMVGLGDLAGGPFLSYGYGVSADGSAVVGTSWSASGFEAFRWTEPGGMVGLGDLPGGEFYSQAYGISADGSVVVGGSAGASDGAFRWTESGGMVGLGDLPGSIATTAFAVSRDGSVVVGRAHMSSHTEAFRWTESEGMVSLGGGSAMAVSADGSVVVGSGAFIWDECHGRRSIQDMLENTFGLNLTGWTLNSATGISADGLTIVGNGTNPSGQYEAWIASIAKDGRHTGDLTGDGNTNFKDFAKLASYWLQDEFFVDVAPLPNGDCVVDFHDVSVLAKHWLEGIYEDFETGDFSKYYWQHNSFDVMDGSALGLFWNVVSDVVYEGSYSARSANTCNSEVTILEITLDTDCNHISFWRKVSSNSGWDPLRFYIDDVKQGEWDGEDDWALETYTVTPGEHTFSWYYINFSGRFGIPPGGSNCAWIDNVRLYSPPTE
ncbi:MAG TPA: hypothetical protein VMW16_03705 [Sedimentisphaerales bacterium]|nr:hypothetical protein [Sedimentisphaerales bacterium]